MKDNHNPKPSNHLFTGREKETIFIEQMLRSRPGRKQLIVFHGPGGIGKSFLDSHLIERSKQKGIPTLLIDCEDLLIPVLLDDLASQLIKDLPETARSFGRFRKAVIRHKRISDKLESLADKDDKKPGQIGKFVGAFVGKAIEASTRALPSGPITDMAGKVLGQAGEALAEATTTKLITSLSNKGLSRDDADFFAHASELLANEFTTAMNAILLKYGCCLFVLDTIELMSYQTEIWIRNHIIDCLDTSRALIVMSGRRELDSVIWRDWDGEIAQRELAPFTPTDSLAYLKKRGVENRKAVNLIFSVSQGLPLSLAIASTIYTSSNINIQSTANDLRAQTVNELLQYFLNHIKDPTQKEILLRCAIPRTLDADLIAQVLPNGSNPLEVFHWLESFSTTRVKANGLYFHDLVRDVLLEYFQTQSPNEFRKLNKKLSDFFNRKRLENSVYSPEWQKATVEYIYHTLSIDEDAAMRESAICFLSAQEFIGHGLINNLLFLIGNYSFTKGHNRTWVDYFRAQFEFLNSRFDRAIRILQQIHTKSDIEPLLRANVVTSLAVLMQYRGDMDKAISLHEEGLQLRRALNDRDGLKRALTNAGRVYRIVRDWNRSIAILGESKLLAEEDGDNIEAGRILLNTGYIALYQGRWDDAERDFTQSLQIARQAEDKYDSSKSLMRLGQLRVIEEQPREAIPLLRQSVREYKMTGELFGEGFAHNYLGDALAKTGEWKSAIKELNLAMKIFQSARVKAVDRVANVHHSFGILYTRKNEWDPAISSFQKAIEIRRSGKAFYYLSKSLNGLAFCSLKQGRLDQIPEWLDESEGYSKKYEDYYELTKSEATRGHLDLYLHKSYSTIAGHYSNAIQHAIRFNGFMLEWVICELRDNLLAAELSVSNKLKLLSKLIEWCRTIMIDGDLLGVAEKKAYKRISSLAITPMDLMSELSSIVPKLK